MEYVEKGGRAEMMSNRKCLLGQFGISECNALSDNYKIEYLICTTYVYM